MQKVKLKKTFMRTVTKPMLNKTEVTTGNFFREKYAIVIATRNTNEASSR